MKNIEDLRNDLIDSFGKLKEGTLKVKEAKEITNMAGKIILSAKTELDYNKFLNNKKEIKFLEVEKKD